MQRTLSRTSDKEKATYLHKVAYIQQLESFISIFTYIIDTEVDLYAASAIFYLSKSSLPHITH
jgi:hypothetical protein